ncbi:MAG TPA: hypothetical protein VGR00_07045 [Thermoanaerobaculia bacterium]|jgi:hypothetical protein|nr:hypothetical protein [Thermoanaerobaculia bacterium]
MRTNANFSAARTKATGASLVLSVVTLVLVLVVVLINSGVRAA